MHKIQWDVESLIREQRQQQQAGEQLNGTADRADLQRAIDEYHMSTRRDVWGALPKYLVFRLGDPEDAPEVLLPCPAGVQHADFGLSLCDIGHLVSAGRVNFALWLCVFASPAYNLPARHLQDTLLLRRQFATFAPARN